MDGLCDRCGTRAYVWLWRPRDKSEWQWCAHHAREYAPILLDGGWVIARDDRAELLPHPALAES